MKKYEKPAFPWKETQAHFHRKSVFYCPHCKGTYSHEEMWQALAKDRDSIWDICQLLKCGWHRVRGMVGKYKLDLHLDGTSERLTWDQLAVQAGFHDAKDLFYELRFTKRMSWARISKLLNRPPEECQEACRAIFDIKHAAERMAVRRMRYALRPDKKQERKKKRKNKQGGDG